MKFPKHWSKAIVEDVGRDGKPLSVSCWRWSDTSAEDARRSALAAAKDIFQRLVRGEKLGAYGYGQRPIREEVLQSQAGEDGHATSAITRNSYGVRVLNTDRVMFIDRDLPPVGLGEKLRHFFARMVGRGGPSPEERQLTDAMNQLEDFLQVHPGWGLRLYRTFAGLRILVTHDLFDPSSDSTREVMESIGADPLYTRLCRDQECFRARLTPKPWRCGHVPNRFAWPHETDDQKERFAQWLDEYERCRQGYQTCRLVGTLGSSKVHPDVEPVIEVHDQQTGCRESLPLA